MEAHCRSYRPHARALSVVVAAAVLAAGCGSTSSTTTSGGDTTTSAAAVLFVQNCGACHRLAAAGTEGSVGADLDETRPGRAAVLQAIADGPGSMPPDLVTGADATAVADYVARFARQ